MNGLDAVYEQQGWSAVRRCAVRQPCPGCRTAPGQRCQRPSRGRGGYSFINGVHSSRVALASYCEEHDVEPGESCPDSHAIDGHRTLPLCQARLDGTAELAAELMSRTEETGSGRTASDDQG